jgi:hypothetical protein
MTVRITVTAPPSHEIPGASRSSFHIEQLRRLPAHVTHEGRLNLFRVALHALEQSMQRRKDIGRALRSDALQVRLKVAELVEDRCLEESDLAWEMSVKRLFAHAELFGEIIHGDTAETVRKEMAPRFGNDPLAGGIFDR